MIALIFSYASAISGIISLLLGIYTLRANPKAALNRLYFALSLSLFLWAFLYSFVYSAPSKELAWFWYKASALGWCTFMGITFHFLIELSGHKKDKGWLIYPLAYGPPLVFLFRVFFKILFVDDLIPGPLCWVEKRATEGTWFFFFGIYTIFLLSWGFYALFRKMKTTSSKRERLRIQLLLKSGISTAVLGIIANLVLPLVLGYQVPALAPIFLLIFSAGAFYAIVKYKIMVIDPIVTADDMLELVQDMVMLLDHDHIIKRVNRSFIKTFGYGEKALLGKSIHTIFPNLKDHIFINSKAQLFLNTKTNEELPVAINVMKINDRFGDNIGSILVMHDLRTVYDLKEEIEKHKQTQQELLNLQRDLEIKIEERTAKLLEVNRKLISESEEKERLYLEIIKREQNYKKIIEAYPDPVAILDNGYNIVYGNEPFAKALSVLEEKGVLTREFINEAQNKHGIELKVHEKFLYMTVLPLTSEEKNFVLILKDITEIKRREIEIKKAYDRYYEILEEITDGYYETDLKGKFVFFNRSWARILELPEKELIGVSYKKIVPKEAWEEVFSIFNKVYKTKSRIKAAKIRYLTPKGLYKHMEISISPVLNKEGEVIGFRGVGRDITEKVRQEELLKESEERFRTLFHTIKYPILIMDGERFIDCNPAALLVFKAKKNDIVGKTPYDFSPEHQPDGSSSAEKARSYVRFALQGESPSFEWKHRRTDGTLFDAEVTLHRMIVAGKPYLLAFVYDLTERKRLEEQLKLTSITDELTGLYNRRGFFEMGERMLKTASRLNKGIFLTFIDLNGLKSINDTYGHSMGDMALKELAKILRSTFRETDLVSRIGGDEYVILAMETDEAIRSNTMVDRIEGAISSFNQKRNLPFELSVSVGVTRWDPGSDIDMEGLMSEADRLMYMDKARKHDLKH